MPKYEEYLRYQSIEETEIIVPVVTFKGERDGPHAVITAGIHGAEYSPIAAATRLCNIINEEDVTGTVTIVTCCNIPALKARTMFVCPIDNKNPNRMFPGHENGSYSDRLAFYITRDIISKADFHLDLHCGDMIESLVPFVEYPRGEGEEIDKKCQEIAEYYGAPDIIGCRINKGRSGHCCYQGSVLAGIPAVLCEFGGHGLCKKEDVENHVRGCINVLKHFGVLKGEAEKYKNIKRWNGYGTLEAPCEGLCYIDVEPGTIMKKDQIVGHMEDLFGHYLGDVVSPVEGKLMYYAESLAVYGDLYLGDIAIIKNE